MAQVDVRGGGVDAELDAQPVAAGQAGGEVRPVLEVLGAAGELVDGLGHGGWRLYTKKKEPTRWAGTS